MRSFHITAQVLSASSNVVLPDALRPVRAVFFRACNATPGDGWVRYCCSPAFSHHRPQPSSQPRPTTTRRTSWEADNDDDKWTVPINVVVSKLSTFGTFPASYQVGFGGFATHPDVGPSWKIRAAIVILLPRARR